MYSYQDMSIAKVRTERKRPRRKKVTKSSKKTITQHPNEEDAKLFAKAIGLDMVYDKQHIWLVNQALNDQLPDGWHLFVNPDDRAFYIGPRESAAVVTSVKDEFAAQTLADIGRNATAAGSENSSSSSIGEEPPSFKERLKLQSRLGHSRSGLCTQWGHPLIMTYRQLFGKLMADLQATRKAEAQATLASEERKKKKAAAENTKNGGGPSEKKSADTHSGTEEHDAPKKSAVKSLSKEEEKKVAESLENAMLHYKDLYGDPQVRV